MQIGREGLSEPASRPRASTVHRAQGTECKVVIFDPVNGESSFLKNEDAVKLINVALSRAKSRLVITVSFP